MFMQSQLEIRAKSLEIAEKLSLRPHRYKVLAEKIGRIGQCKSTKRTIDAGNRSLLNIINCKVFKEETIPFALAPD